MYAYISGQVTYKSADCAVIETSGVGYLLFCSSYTLNTLSLNTNAKLYTHMHVAEDEISLYGFATQDERDMFRKLISVTRIGKKLALGILSHLTVGDIAMAIATDNAAAFDKIPGMGKKTAARVLLELKEKVSPSSVNVRDADAPAARESSFSARAEAIEALVALGYDGLSAGRAVGAIKDDEFSDVQSLIKLCLAKLTSGGMR